MHLERKVARLLTPLSFAQLLDAGLRRLVGRALRVRVRTFRDYAQGDLFLGRSYDINSDDAPRVEVDRLEVRQPRSERGEEATRDSERPR